MMNGVAVREPGRSLFAGKDLPDESRERTQRALERVKRVPIEQLLARDVELQLADFLEPFSEVRLRWDEPTMDDLVVDDVPAGTDFAGRPVTLRALRTRISIPIDGEPAVLYFRSHSGAPGSRIEGVVQGDKLVFDWVGEQDERAVEQIPTWLEQHKARVEMFLQHNNADIPGLNEQMSTAVRHAIEARRDEELRRRRLSAALPFPIERAPSAVRPVHVQRQVRLPRVNPAPSFTPEPAIEDARYEEILRDCAAMARVFERTPVGARLSEPLLRDLLLGMLNTNFSGDVAGELFNGAGKTDICVRVEDRNVFIGECKFYDGPSSVADAINQLLGYVVWRDTKAALLLFVRRGSFTDAVTKARAAIASHERCSHTVTSDNETERNDFIFTRADDPDRAIKLALLPFRLMGD